MGSRKPIGTVGTVADDRPGETRAPFEVWIDRGLHALYDGIKDEPIPDELLRLIEEDRRK